MEISEFKTKTVPRAKKSRLWTFQEQIFELKQSGYANIQISEWLALNGLVVSQEAVRKFLKKSTYKNHKIEEKKEDESTLEKKPEFVYKSANLFKESDLI